MIFIRKGLYVIDLKSKDMQTQKLHELQNSKELKNIFPEIFEDGKINIEKFKSILFGFCNEKIEHYSFNWSGKSECYKTIKEPSNLTLKCDDDKTVPDGDNVFIEGDNLEVLKLLQTSYHKKIKMIYIDPPYNKDKDFVYSDTWGDTITNYLIQTDQLCDEGYTSTKISSSGRRHTNWLNMMYPRLWLSRNLLKDDGVIFVSIDDDEVANLRKMMDEIYGEENFVGCLKWKRKKQPSYLHGQIAKVVEYILVYAKNIDNLDKLSIDKRTDSNTRLDNATNLVSDRLIRKGVRVKLPEDIKIIKKGVYKNKTMSTEYLSDVFIENRLTQNDVIVKAKFRNKQSDIDLFVEKKVLFITKNYGFRRDLLEKEKEKKKSITDLLLDWGDNQDSDKELVELFGENKPFDYSKPSLLIKNLIKSVTLNKDDIILDFFAGSGTTAQAVMELNKEDNGNRKYILVQLPEPTDEKSEAYKNGYKKISLITKERIKRAIKKLGIKNGFKSYYLDSSNFAVFKQMIKSPETSFEDIIKMLKMSVFNRNIFTQNAKNLDIVYEVGLKNGFSLSAEHEEIKTDKYNFMKLHEEQKEVYFCFDDEIKLDIKDYIPQETKLICIDNALDDEIKLNLREYIELETL